ncbi:MAG: hypothetical protein V2I97_24485 [Desulfococcaceae bacterium]|jgi:hypothetical protein|nr:hypothetical protein [Desulfococcaceae bacterium]
MTYDKIKNILDILNTLNEYLLSLPDDMLLNIDPRDNESLEQGIQFIKEFNDSFSQFSDGANRIEKQIKNYFSIDPEGEEMEHEITDNEGKNGRVIKELDKSESHTPDENFTYKRPYGFVLDNSAYKGIKTWKSLYIQILKELNSKDPERFSGLPTEKRFISRRGNPLFSVNENDLRIAEKLSDDFCAEINLSANHIIKNIKILLDYFGIDYKKLQIYLREDRDA